MSQWNKDYDKYIKENTAATNKKIEQRSAGLNQIVDNATNQAVGKVQNEIDKLPTAYQSAYDVNAIQQKINEREVAERMANLGLTNSGLNRTQQTAINIQRANADAALTQQKNAATASLKQQIADLYASGENQKAQNKLNVYNTYMDELDSSAVAYANNQASNRAAIQKAQIEAAAKKQERYEKWALENGYTYDAKGNLIKSNYSTPVGKAKPTSAQYDSILNMYVMEQGYKNPTSFAEKVIKKYPNLDYSAVVNYLAAIEMTDDGGENYGGFLGMGYGGIDENGAIGYGDDKTITMQDLYDRLIKAGYDEDTAEKMVINYQHYMGI